MADAGCNFYLGAAITIAAGLEGCAENSIQVTPSSSTPTIRRSKSSWPRRDGPGASRVTWGEAIEAFANDELARGTLASFPHNLH